MKHSYMKESIQCRLGNDPRISINLSKMVNYPCEVMIELTERLSFLSVVNGEKEKLDSFGSTFFHVMEQAATDERSYDVLCTLNEYFGLVAFEAKYSICIWQVLTLLYENREAYDMYASCPTLFWLVLTELNKQQQPIQVIAATMRKKRKILLDVCGLPPRKSVLNVLRNLEGERFSDSTRRLLHQFDWEKNSSRLAHIKKIYPVSMCLIDLYPGIEGARFIREPGLPVTWQYLQPFHDCVQMALRLRLPSCLPLLKSCGSLPDVFRVHDRLVDRLIATQERNLMQENFQFPTPPLPGTQDIIPLTCYADLVSEGIQMKHCVSTYSDRVMSGRYYVYRVKSPERATIGLNILADGSISIDQVRGRSNKSVDPKTLGLVNVWLYQRE